jgi:hypothetical protein
MKDKEGSESGGRQSAEAVALSARCDAGVRALVGCLSAEPAQPGRDDG